MPRKYVLDQELGAGGMGRVYRARLVGEAGFERPVVMKKLLDALAFEVTATPLRETSDYVKSEVAKWAKVVRDVGAKVD